MIPTCLVKNMERLFYRDREGENERGHGTEVSIKEVEARFEPGFTHGKVVYYPNQVLQQLGKNIYYFFEVSLYKRRDRMQRGPMSLVVSLSKETHLRKEGHGQCFTLLCVKNHFHVQYPPLTYS